MPLLIDGHNLLWAVQGVADDAEEVSDVKLCYIIGRYLVLIGEVGEIVFDGTGPRNKSRFENVNMLETIFSGMFADADSVIEDKIKLSTAPRRLTVVSSDRRLRDAARSRKAKCLKSEDFWEEVVRELGRKRGPREPAAKEWGLSEAETQKWLEFFGMD